MSNNSQFTLHTHPRDKRVAVFDKEYQVVYVLFSWYHKCLKLEEPEKSYVTKDEALYVYLKAKAPHVLEEEENTVDAYLLMDMLTLYPNDEWLLNLEKTHSPFKVHNKHAPEDIPFIALECTKTHEIFIPYEMFCGDESDVAIESNDMSTETMCSFLYIHFPDHDGLLDPPIYTLEFMLSKFPKDKWLLSLKEMQEKHLPKKNSHYDIVYPEDLFNLIRHPRDGRVCVENQLSKVKLIPVKWFKKCLNLPRGRNSIFSNHTTNQVRHYLAENAPEIFEGKNPWNIPTFTLEDMLIMYPNDEWLHELNGSVPPPPSPPIVLEKQSQKKNVLSKMQNQKDVLSKMQSQKKTTLSKMQKKKEPVLKKRERQEKEGEGESGEDSGDIRSLVKKWKEECIEKNIDRWKQDFIEEHQAQWRREYQALHQDAWDKEGQEFARKGVVEFLMSKIRE